MLRPRIIPCLLLSDGGLVKTIKFKSPKYVGDPINTVKIFNEKIVDELMVLDIDATVKSKEPDYKIIADIASECRSPLCYGGGIYNTDQAKRIIGLGVEKIAISSSAVKNINLVKEISKYIGKQSVVVVLDIKKTIFGKNYKIYTNNGTNPIRGELIDIALELEEAGAGEIVFNFIELDGTMNGYDLNEASKLSGELAIPITFLGGASSLNNIGELFKQCGIIGAGAGSLFVFKGKHRAVLVNYPNLQQKNDMFNL